MGEKRDVDRKQEVRAERRYANMIVRRARPWEWKTQPASMVGSFLRCRLSSSWASSNEPLHVFQQLSGCLIRDRHPKAHKHTSCQHQCANDSRPTQLLDEMKHHSVGEHNVDASV